MNNSRSLMTRLLAVPMLILLGLPIVAITMASSVSDLIASTQHPLFRQAIYLSITTSLVSLTLVVLLGTPLAWWLSQTSRKTTAVVTGIIDLPILLPPAVIGLALLMTFGQEGLLGPWITASGVKIPFTMGAVVLAQVTVSAPFFIQSALSAFKRIEPNLLQVGQTLGHAPRSLYYRVVIPLALPGLLSGAALCWARALGEFGATLLFAGNLPGKTQTMPLAIYTTLEADVRIAIALSLVLVALAVVLMTLVRMKAIGSEGIE